ncbi:hypothetical protein [Hufsiella ginkgonis]|uniref:Uncharacterized protein n=1 Tax=Hufsiella ginkgonis TaxID=2695274 RepID=A0A7K1Y0M2_9SPHI|nr:hypothetical protein [Hufsiella ginkgonis]MXV16783.1 hypothetical protein [Hufsiella ginkgonis]
MRFTFPVKRKVCAHLRILVRGFILPDQEIKHGDLNMAKRKYRSLTSHYADNEKYLFIGNGINQLQLGAVSWGHLLVKACKKAKVNITRGNKAYPLFFEEMSFKYNFNRRVGENIKALKKFIGGKALSLQLHARYPGLVQSDHYQHYLATNYDYYIERSIPADHDPEKGKNAKRQKSRRRTGCTCFISAISI